jgi:hypothetical protein
MPFGKYKGRELADVPESYLVWVLEHAQAAGPVLRAAIRRRLGLGPDGWSGNGWHPSPSPPPPRQDLAPLRADLLAGVAAFRRRLAARLHPDRGGDGELMQAVNAAADDLEAAVRRALR